MLRTVSMMQPYLFPYLGYFQLIALSDVFVLGDDLQFVRGSWMNRNRILVNGQPKLISFPLKKGHQTERINQRWLCDDFDKEAAGLMLTLERCYAKAPQRDAVLPLIRGILQCPERNLALFTENSLRCLCAYLGIRTPIYRGSSLGLPAKMDMQDRVIQITHRMDGELYLNPIGGMELYCPARFRAEDRWALLCFSGTAIGAPRWVLYREDGDLVTADLESICRELRGRLASLLRIHAQGSAVLLPGNSRGQGCLSSRGDTVDRFDA